MKKSIQYIKCFFPLILIFISEYYRIIGSPIGVALKVIAMGMMIAIVVLKGKFNKTMVTLTIMIIPFLVIGFFVSFNYKAALEELVRYSFPIIVLFYGYSIRSRFELLLKFLIIFLVINQIAQVFNYIYWLYGINQWFYIYTPTGRVNIPSVNGVLRATGLLGFFSVFGFFNLIMYFMINFFYTGKHKKTLLILTVISLFLSLSFKGIGTFLFLICIFSKKKAQIIKVAISTFVLFLIFFPGRLYFLWKNLQLRISAYISEGNSARSESYRVMFDKTNFFVGEGLGAFGGPASTKFNSPFYDRVDFNWFGLAHLQTTDTYYPHLFIELGFIGGLLYLFFMISPFMKLPQLKGVYLKFVLIVYFSLFVDAIFSYSLNNLTYLIFSILLIYPVIYFANEKKGESVVYS